MEFLPIILDGKRVYAGFWKRFCAALVNGFVILPLMFLCIWLKNFDRNLAIFITIPSTALFCIYNVYFNACFGGTLGKLAVGIRITKPDGTKIGWQEAWKRSSVDLALGFLMLCVEVWALAQVNSEQYSAVTFSQQRQLLQSHYPSWYSIITTSQQIWIWSELLVLLFNRRKRAIHDFIAGTVVIHKEFINLQKNGIL
jgi:uncharacterized RDD family membrane protein YckC